MIAWGCEGGFGFSWVASFQIGLPDFLGPGKAVALLGVAVKNIYGYQISENQLYRRRPFNESGVMARALYRRDHQVLIKLLRTIRENANLTQAECSRALGRPQSFISDVEKGLRRLDLVQLRDLCTVLGYELPRFISEYEEALAAG
nr:helix-turn-helix domain-containing protein [Pseudomonas cichorii]